MMRQLLVAVLSLCLAFLASATPGPAEQEPPAALTNEEILRNAWRPGGATPEIIREVAANDYEWEEIVQFAKKSGTIPGEKLAELREKLVAGDYYEVVFTPDTLLEWVWGKNHTGGFALRNVLVQREQDAYRIELADGYVVYLLAKCFNFTLAQRMEATIETEAPAPTPTPVPIATPSPSPTPREPFNGQATPTPSPTPAPKKGLPRWAFCIPRNGHGVMGKIGNIVGRPGLCLLAVWAGARIGGDDESDARPTPEPTPEPDKTGAGGEPPGGTH